MISLNLAPGISGKVAFTLAAVSLNLFSSELYERRGGIGEVRDAGTANISCTCFMSSSDCGVWSGFA